MPIYKYINVLIFLFRMIFMRNNKFIFMAMIILVSLLCVSAVSAADDAASDVIADTDTNDVAVLEESIDDASLADSQSDENVLTDDSNQHTFTDLQEKVSNADNVLELASNFTFDKDEDEYDLRNGVTIDHDLTINGNGYTINAIKYARIFKVTGNSKVTFNNINFINGWTDVGGRGGAIWSVNSPNVKAINCNFTNNGADIGGAVSAVTVENCIFTGNKAFVNGGAIDKSNATNCTFINNGDCYYGGAIYSEEVPNCFAINCTFIGNYAKQGGAIAYVTAINSTFTSNRAEGAGGGAIYEGNATNCNFTQNKAVRGGAIYDGNATNCRFDQNEASIDGGALYVGNANDCIFTDNKAEYGNCTFTNNAAENIGGAALKVTANDCIFINNTAKNNGGAIYESDAINCNFTQNYAQNGGAIYDGDATDCNFIDNKAEVKGGAIYDGGAINCNFTGNFAQSGGAIFNTSAQNCNFLENVAILGGAVNNDDNKEKTLDNCSFTKNSAINNGGAVWKGYANNCTFTQNSADEEGGAMYFSSAVDCNFTQNSAQRGGGALYYSYATNCNFAQNSGLSGGAMSWAKAINCSFILNTAEEEGTNDLNYVTNEDCTFIIPVLNASDLNTTFNYGGKFNFNLSTEDEVFDGLKATISIYKNGTFVNNYTALTGSAWTVNLPGGTYKAVLSIPGSNVEPLTKTIKVAKDSTQITASAVTATYNVNKYLTIKLLNSKGKALSGVKVTVTLGSAKTYKTDKNGQIKINVAKLVPKTYTAKISFAGNANYTASSKSVKVTVKKATPKFTAKAKTFKVKVKTKKYKVTLKNNKGKVMKKVKLTLKVNKKTFKATTNSKGVATFKITNLKKKGKFTAVIKYAGSKYYNKLSKKAKITVKK